MPHPPAHIYGAATFTSPLPQALFLPLSQNMSALFYVTMRHFSAKNECLLQNCQIQSKGIF